MQFNNPWKCMPFTILLIKYLFYKLNIFIQGYKYNYLHKETNQVI